MEIPEHTRTPRKKYGDNIRESEDLIKKEYYLHLTPAYIVQEHIKY